MARLAYRLKQDPRTVEGWDYGYAVAIDREVNELVKDEVDLQVKLAGGR